MTHRLATNYAKNYCNRTLIVKVIVENVVTCFWGDTVYNADFSVCYLMLDMLMTGKFNMARIKSSVVMKSASYVSWVHYNP